jgi:dTDP-4-dehydrorhamnose reductase
VIKILLTGRSGQIGWELQRTLTPLGKLTVLSHQEMNLADPEDIRRVMREHRPDVVVNAAAYTEVEKAEEEPTLAMAVNGTAPGILAEEAKQSGALLVHYSTDYVFDGEKKAPYTEDDVPNPLNVYGKTKLAGEQAIKAVGAPHLILRTSWVYGARGSNFLLTILRLAQEREELKVVNDQTGAPTWSRMIAEATALILGKIYLANPPHEIRAREATGIYHLTASGQTTWFEFADTILRGTVRLTPISAAKYPLQTKRPRNSLMSNRKLGAVFGLVMPSWQNMFELFREEMHQL